MDITKFHEIAENIKRLGPKQKYTNLFIDTNTKSTITINGGLYAYQYITHRGLHLHDYLVVVELIDHIIRKDKFTILQINNIKESCVPVECITIRYGVIYIDT